MAKKHEDNWLDIIKRLRDLSNLSPEAERQQLLEAARQEPRILDDKDITLADIAKLAGIKEYTETKVSKKAEALIESILKDDNKTESVITKTIRESDQDVSLSKQITKKVTEDSKRLDTIADLEAKLAELKAEQKAEQTYDREAFREVLSKDIKEYIKTAEDKDLVELYNSISDNEAVYNEESSSILIKTEDTKEIIADAEKVEQELIAEKEKTEDEPVKEYDKKEYDKGTEGWSLVSKAKDLAKKYAGDMTKAYDEIEKLEKGLSQNDAVRQALKQHNEAHGHEGQSEFRAHTIRLMGDFDQENPVSDADAEAVKKAIMKNSGEQEGRSIVVDVEPSEDSYDSVVVHTMRDRDEILGYMGDMVDEQVEYTDELSENNQQGK